MQWVKTLAVASAITTLAVSGVAQDRDQTYGKSNDQILTMGYDAWYKFYIAKEGGSGVGIAGAPALYADALAARNDRLLRTESPVRRRRLTSLRTHFRTYANSAIVAGSATTGGGTMWNPVASSLHMDAEKTFYGLLVRRTPSSPPRRVSDVTRELTRERTRMESQMVANEIEALGRRRGRAAFSDLERTYQTIATQAGAFSRVESDLILNFCLRTVKGLIPSP